MCNYYRINVSKNGEYLFATEAVGGGGGGITCEKKAMEVIRLLKERLPESEGYSITCTYWRGSGERIDC